jgi:hypothetical protein
MKLLLAQDIVMHKETIQVWPVVYLNRLIQLGVYADVGNTSCRGKTKPFVGAEGY